MSICLFACAKNEHDYIYEWIYYHLKIGFDEIYICDTSDDNNMKTCTFKNDSRIKLVHEKLNGEKFGHLQYQFQNKYLNNFIKKKHKWAAFIDIDEFIVIKKHKNIKEFLNSINFKKGSLGMNWVIFGNNNQQKYIKEPVIKRFTRCDDKYDKHVKILVCTNSVDHFNNPHFAVLKEGIQINENKKKFECGPWQEESSNNEIQVNHYVLKSKEEYLNRTKNHHTRQHNNIHYIYHNRNHIEDLSALNLLLYNNNLDNINTFDYEFYIQNNLDLLVNGIYNLELALEHFNNLGKNEKRISNFNFDFYYYRNNNNDLKNLSDIELWNHFKNFGLKEKRNFNLN